MYSLVPSVRVDVVLVQACGSSRNRWSHYYYGVIGTSSTSGLGMYLVLRYGEILRFAGNMFTRAFFTHVETPLLVWFLCISSVKTPLSRDSGLILRTYFLLASKLLMNYQATVYPTAYPLYCDLFPPSPLPHRIHLRLRSRTSHHYNSWLPY